MTQCRMPKKMYVCVNKKVKYLNGKFKMVAKKSRCQNGSYKIAAENHILDICGLFLNAFYKPAYSTPFKICTC